MTALTVPTSQVRQTRWIHSALTDTVIAFAWVPFVLAALLVRGNSTATAGLMTATLLFSFTHQPLTLALVYGDPRQFAVARRIFTWSPLVFALGVYLFLNVSFTILAIIGAVWNAIHTLFQRYGLVRIYGRKVGEQDGRLERAMLMSWLLAAAVLAAANSATPDRVVEAGLNGHNSEAVNVLTDFQRPASFLVPLVLIASAVLLTMWIRREHAAGDAANPAKHLYVGSTAVLLLVMVIEPIAGLIGYVGSHAFEYFVIVYTNLKTRYLDHPDDRAPVAQALRTPLGRPGFLVVYLGFISAIVVGLSQANSVTAYFLVFFVLGGLHVFYDGFIWKLKRARVADSFDLPAASSV